MTAEQVPACAREWSTALDDAAAPLRAATSAGAVRQVLLSGRLAALVEQIEASQLDAATLRAWGRSSLVSPTVADPLLTQPVHAYLHAGPHLGTGMDYPFAHAGMAHVYGYLLSDVQTRFGLKRERWTTPETAAAFGLPADALSPWGGPGTLLQRVTAAAWPVLCEPSRFRPRRWRDTTARGPQTAVVIRAVVVGRGPTPDSLAMVYGYRVDGDGWRLATTFPLAPEGLAGFDAVPEPWRPRYNTAVPVDLTHAALTTTDHV